MLTLRIDANIKNTDANIKDNDVNNKDTDAKINNPTGMRCL